MPTLSKSTSYTFHGRISLKLNRDEFRRISLYILPFRNLCTLFKSFYDLWEKIVQKKTHQGQSIWRSSAMLKLWTEWKHYNSQMLTLKWKSIALKIGLKSTILAFLSNSQTHTKNCPPKFNHFWPMAKNSNILKVDLEIMIKRNSADVRRLSHPREHTNDVNNDASTFGHHWVICKKAEKIRTFDLEIDGQEH